MCSWCPDDGGSVTSRVLLTEAGKGLKEQESDFFFLPWYRAQYNILNNRLWLIKQFTVPQSDAEELSTLSHLILTTNPRLHFHITNEETKAHVTQLMGKMAKIQTQIWLTETSFLFTIDI